MVFYKRHLQELLQEDAPIIEFVVKKTALPEQIEIEDTMDPVEQVKRLREKDPIIRAIMDQFGGEPVW